MKLVTWNLNGLEDEHLDVRTESAMFQILLGAPIEDAMVEGFKPNTPDIILLQEVVERTFHAHVKTHLKAAGFTLFPHEPSERSYFEVIAVRQPMEPQPIVRQPMERQPIERQPIKHEPIINFSYHTFEYTDQGRGLSTLTINGLTIMTAHMESMKSGKSMRIDQAKSILEKMNQCESPCIFGGDTNLRKAEWETLKPDTVSDAWQNSGSPKKHRMTWEQHPYKGRYDRVWTQGLNIKSFETFGTKHVNGIQQRPSDHRGIRVEFVLI